MNTSETCLGVEQFSLKMKWRLAETLLYNKAVKKDPHGRREGT